MAYYKTAISFGLVHIPVELNPIIKDNNASFNMLHKKCMDRVIYKRYCTHCEEEVNNEDLVKGYEYRKNEYVVFEEEDFDKLKTENDKLIEIIAFVNLNEIDPIYYEKSYSLLTKDKNRAFSLFKKALEKSNKVAIARTYLRGKCYYVVLRFGKKNIIMNTLYFEEEVKIDVESIEEEFSSKEMDLAIKLINGMSDKFKPETYNDEYQERVKEAINEKIDGKEIKPIKGKKQKSIADLMQALEESLKDNKK